MHRSVTTMLQIDVGFRRGAFELIARTRIDTGVTGICGPSGCGKSTLLGLLAGLLKPHRGTLWFGEEVLCDVAQRVFVPPWQRHFGLVFQDGQLFPHLSVRSNLLYGHALLDPAERHFALAAVSQLMELTPLLDRRPALLSGGERQRVALGRALLYSPRLLLLDEP